MNWILAKTEKPNTYITGIFDGKNSDEVIVRLKSGKHKIAIFNNGFMDGSNFECWYSDGWDINDEVESWHKIPN